MIVGDDVAIFRDEEAGPLSDRAQSALVLGALGLVLAMLLTAALLLFELAEELLQRVVIRKIIEATAETKGIIVIGNRVDTGFDTNRNDGRRHCIHHIGKARNLRRLNIDGIGVGTGDHSRNTRSQSSDSEAGDDGSLHSGAAGQGVLDIPEHMRVTSSFLVGFAPAQPAMVRHGTDIGRDTLQRTVRPMKNS